MVLSASEEGGDQGIRAISDAALRGAASAQGPDDAEDAAQDAIVGMIASSATYGDPAAVARRAGRFRGIDRGRSSARRREAERAYFGNAEDATPSPENAVDARLHVKALLEIAQSELTTGQFDGLISLYY